MQRTPDYTLVPQHFGVNRRLVRGGLLALLAGALVALLFGGGGKIRLSTLEAGGRTTAGGDAGKSAGGAVASADGGRRMAVYFLGTTRKSTAVAFLQKNGFLNAESSYDTVRATVGLVVPPTCSQLSRLRSANDVWQVSYEGDDPRCLGASPVPPERERRLERARDRGALCSTNRLEVGLASHLTEADVRDRLRWLPTADVRSVRKPANDVTVPVDDPSEASDLRALTDREIVQIVSAIQ